ncbi:MAG: UxaA family hydrolase [Bacillota bacterium]
MEFKGYVRDNGEAGVRNHLAILPSAYCANRVADLIARQVEGATALTHTVGCGQIGADFEQTANTLKGLGINPNVGAVLVVGLGCERFQPDELAADIAARASLWKW